MAFSAKLPGHKLSFDLIKTLKSFEDNLSGFWVSKEVELGCGRDVSNSILVSSHHDNVFDVSLKVLVQLHGQGDVGKWTESD